MNQKAFAAVMTQMFASDSKGDEELYKKKNRRKRFRARYNYCNFSKCYAMKTTIA